MAKSMDVNDAITRCCYPGYAFSPLIHLRMAVGTTALFSARVQLFREGGVTFDLWKEEWMKFDG